MKIGHSRCEHRCEELGLSSLSIIFARPRVPQADRVCPPYMPGVRKAPLVLLAAVVLIMAANRQTLGINPTYSVAMSEAVGHVGHAVEDAMRSQDVMMAMPAHLVAVALSAVFDERTGRLDRSSPTPAVSHSKPGSDIRAKL